LSKEEYEIAVADAEVAKQAYLENAASNVDENTVKLIPDASELTAAKGIFETTCSACHGKKGEGAVGPNLTDDFWIHGGSVQDVFKTIKYGWPEKGMKSWKDDYSPVQIAQLTSYVKLLHGTNPPNGKAAQGTLFIEQPAAAPKGDSTKKDSSVVAVK
jgi:cytochrome c oxidase cbb3-type subunit 3